MAATKLRWTPAQSAWAIEKKFADRTLESFYIRLLLKAKARGILIGVRREARLMHEITDWDAAAVIPEEWIERTDLTLRAVQNARENVNAHETVARRVGHRDGHESYAIVTEQKAKERRGETAPAGPKQETANAFA